MVLIACHGAKVGNKIKTRQVFVYYSGQGEGEDWKRSQDEFSRGGSIDVSLKDDP